jgi:hypothetical protein
MRKKKEKMRKGKKEERKREKYEKKKKYIGVRVKIKIKIKMKSELPGSLKCIRNLKASRLKDSYSLSNHVQSDNGDFLCASGSLFAICTCSPISSVCIFLFPLLDIYYFQ